MLIQASVLSETDHYPIALLRDLSAQDLRLRVSLKLVSGKLSRSAGLLWRARDNHNYYAFLANGLTHDFRLLSVREDHPTELVKTAVAFDKKNWNLLEISAHGDRITAKLNQREILNIRDHSRLISGRAGILTHADTIALFDDLFIQTY